MPMPAEATQDTGADDVVDLESMFANDPDGTNGDQGQVGDGTQPQNTQADGDANADGDELELDLDGDGDEEEVVDDPNAQQQTEVLVVPDDHEVKLVVNGQERVVKYGELVAAAQKYEGADQKFQEAAAIRKEYTDKAQTLGTRENQLGQVLQYYIEQSQQLMQSQQPDWVKLLAEDPQKYLTERHNWELKQAELNAARQVQANLAKKQADDRHASEVQRAREEHTKLVAALPAWADQRVAAEGAREIDQYLEAQGLTPEMRAQADTAAVILIARKAMLYDRAMEKQQQARKAGGAQGQRGAARQQGVQRQQQQLPRQQQPSAGRVERPGAGRSAAQNAASQENLQRANREKRFNANPSVDTLADFF